jgi:protein SMG7
MQNRQSYGQLPDNNKVPIAKTLPPRASGRGRGRGEVRFQPKDVNAETAARERECNILDTLKTFYIRFVRLNGILFTRTRYIRVAYMTELLCSTLLRLVSTCLHNNSSFFSPFSQFGNIWGAVFFSQQ